MSHWDDDPDTTEIPPAVGRHAHEKSSPMERYNAHVPDWLKVLYASFAFIILLVLLSPLTH